MKIRSNHTAIKLMALSLVVLMVGGFLLKGKIPHEQFNSKEWKNWTETEMTLSLRWDMMNSLRNSHKLVGDNRSEIIELLGEAESKTNTTFRYNLGYSKRGINTGNLILKFDSKGKVVAYRVLQE